LGEREGFTITTGGSGPNGEVFVKRKWSKKMLSNDRFDKEIQNIVEQLVRLYNPQKIILFGSLASGRLNSGTDIDLFIIKEDVPDLGVDRIRQLERLIKYRLATDFIVYKAREVEQRLKLGDPFVQSIFKEGRVIYDAK
jgi:predicted nucleotidyltransferase